MQTNRNFSVDLFRFLAAFAVISIHVEYGDLSKNIESVIRLFGRWAGPFFFGISGYYFQIRYQSKGDSALLKTLKEMATILIIADLLFLPFSVLRDGNSLAELLTFKSICLGTYFHLWFIGSLFFGYLVLWLAVSNNRYILMGVVSATVLFLLLASDSYSFLGMNLFDAEFSRFFMAIPYLYIGFLFSKYKIEEKVTMPLCYFLIIAGFIIELAEAGLIHKISGYDVWAVQVLFGTYIYGFGVTLLSLKLIIRKDNIFSFIGRRYSLHLFLYHPFLNVCIFFILKHIGVLNYVIWFSPFIAIGFNIIVWGMTEKYFPKIFYFLVGKFNVEINRNEKSVFDGFSSFFKKNPSVYYDGNKATEKVA